MTMLVGPKRTLLGPRGLRYLLRATFDANDQGYVNGVTYSTAAKGVQDGTLTVVEVDGTLAIVSNKLAFTAQGSPTQGDLGMYSQAVTRALGRGLLGTLNINDVTKWVYILWKDDQNVNPAVAGGNRLGLSFTADLIYVSWQAVGALSLGLVPADATVYQCALILGGYDTNGLPYYAGQAKASYTFGAWFFIKGGAFATWTLLWAFDQGNTATLYAALSNYDAAGTLDDFRVPDKDLSAIQVPAAYSSFTAANGTSLDAITPEVGGAWTEQVGSWEIQGNEAIPVAVSFANGDAASISTGQADAILDCTVTPQWAGVADYSRAAILMRYSDSTHYWEARVDPQGNVFLIMENDGGFTIRATAAVAITGGTSYAIRAILDGQTIDGFLDGANKISYGSAALNESSALHGVRAGKAVAGAAPTFDNWACYPRTSAQYEAVLGSV